MLTPQSFSHNQFGKLRILSIDSEPWFIANDVCYALGYRNSRDTIAKHVDDEDKRILNREEILNVANRDGQKSRGGAQFLTIINESGFYSLVLGSKLPTAKDFKNWVTHDVLPSIRKHGLYATEDLFEKLISDPKYFANVLNNLAAEREARYRAEETVKLQSQQISELQPKASYYDAILSSPHPISISEIAQDYGMSGKRLNQILQHFGVQYYLERSQCWLLSSKYLGNGYTKIIPDHADVTYKKQHMYWTQR